MAKDFKNVACLQIFETKLGKVKCGEDREWKSVAKLDCYKEKFKFRYENCINK